MTDPTQRSTEPSGPLLGSIPGAARGSATCQEQGRGLSTPGAPPTGGPTGFQGGAASRRPEKAMIPWLVVCFSICNKTHLGWVFFSLSLNRVRTGTLSQDPPLALGIPAFHGDNGYHSHFSEQEAEAHLPMFPPWDKMTAHF